ncbi:MAG: PAS domain-containing protein [Spirochaetales bacterium]|nr:PAS domain-containing protein [Spirochaetales bacterium]
MLGRQKKHYKILVMTVLLAVTLSLTIFFHIFLKKGAVVTHFFYIPIILAAIWWKKGYIVALFLSLFLVLNHLFVRSGVEIYNDLLRAFMFVFVYFIVTMLSEKLIKTEKGLALIRTEMDQIFQNSVNGIAIIGPEGKIIKTNAMLKRLLERTESDIVGKRCSQILCNPDCDTARCPIKRITGGDTCVETIFEIGDTTGKKKKTCCSSATPFWDTEGTVKGFVFNIRDITEKMKTKKTLARYRSKLKAISSELTLAEEKERRRIATNLHDHIGQKLALAKIKLGALKASHKNHPDSSVIEEVRSLVEDTIRTTRSLTFTLSPPVLYEFGLIAAFEWLIDHYRDRYGLSCDFYTDIDRIDMNEDMSILLFKIINELLLNVVKHAGTDIAAVDIHGGDDGVTISVCDRGKGFDSGRLETIISGCKGFGLFNIRERLNYIGGRLDIESAEGAGTKVNLMIPFAKKSCLTGGKK